ncbi:MAG: Response regulator receiver domain [Chloroflexota bacterium]|jgi:DNA-binding response OmpR family regulator|nr:Response regulator receiver domain [Chloroflexota bacterium]
MFTRLSAPAYVLILEGDPLAAATLSANWSWRGIPSRVATEVDEARLLIARQRPSLVLIDLDTPAAEELASECRAPGSRIPFILISSAPDARALAAAVGAVAYVPKPIDVERPNTARRFPE